MPVHQKNRVAAQERREQFRHVVGAHDIAADENAVADRNKQICVVFQITGAHDGADDIFADKLFASQTVYKKDAQTDIAVADICKLPYLYCYIILKQTLQLVDILLQTG